MWFIVGCFVAGGIIGLLLPINKKEKKHTGLKAGIIGVSIWNQFCKDAKKRK